MPSPIPGLRDNQSIDLTVPNNEQPSDKINLPYCSVNQRELQGVSENKLKIRSSID